jgi:mono/diheme cytochrome c family protein
MNRHGLVLLVMLIAVCFGTSQDQSAPSVFMPESGLTKEDRAKFYHLAEGSELFPLAAFNALTSIKTGKPFRENLERFGFVTDTENAEGLPIGLTAAETRGLEVLGKMIGINCAACHVGQITYQGKAVRLDGAPNILDTRAFFAELADSTKATLEDPAKLTPFLAEYYRQKGGQAPSAALSRVTAAAGTLFQKLKTEKGELNSEVLAALKAVLSSNEQDPDHKAQQVDPAGALATLRKRVEQAIDSKMIDALKSKAEGLLPDAIRDDVGNLIKNASVDMRLLKARLSFLKNLAAIGQAGAITEWGPGRVDAFGSVRSLFFEPGFLPAAPVSYPHLWGMKDIAWFHYDGNTTSVLQRNLGQALGVGAIFEPKTLASTLKPGNSHTLEHLAYQIKAPVWPADLLGAIDSAKVERGQQLFTANCAQCHADNNTYKTPEQAGGTDAVRALSFGDKLKDGRLYFEALRDTLDPLTNKALEDAVNNKEITQAMADEWKAERPNQWQASGKYRAGSLKSVWATAPFLHNGSVPTLDDLLRRADQRPKTFSLGSREFDPVKIGLKSMATTGAYQFDTTRPGNSNAGHEFGCDLSDAQKADLLEYLKTR